jgi:hypothetical protein
MIELLILAVIFLFLFKLFSPKIEYIRQSKMWICHYDKGNSRDWFIIYRE